MQTAAQRRSSVAAAALTAARPSSRTSPIALIHSAVPSAAGRTRDLGIHSQAARHNSRSRSVAAAASRRDSDSAAQPSSTGRLSRTGKPVGWSVLPGDDDDDRLSDDHDADAAEPGPRTYDDDEEVYQPRVDLVGGSSSGAEDAPLPEVSRGQVFASCAQVSIVLTLFAFGLRAYGMGSIAALGNDRDTVERLLALPHEASATHAAVAVAAAVGVTAARQALLGVWPEFAAASQRSNKQVLTPLSWPDLLWVAALPGLSEELLFRGALIPALFPDWRGVLLAGVAFGLLHNNGGRNWAFAAWASLVGITYGAALLYTEDVAVPMAAHSLANLASAALWRQQQADSGA